MTSSEGAKKERFRENRWRRRDEKGSGRHLRKERSRVKVGGENGSQQPVGVMFRSSRYPDFQSLCVCVRVCSCILYILTEICVFLTNALYF